MLYDQASQKVCAQQSSDLIQLMHQHQNQNGHNTGTFQPHELIGSSFGVSQPLNNMHARSNNQLGDTTSSNVPSMRLGFAQPVPIESERNNIGDSEATCESQFSETKFNVPANLM